MKRNGIERQRTDLLGTEMKSDGRERRVEDRIGMGIEKKIK